MTIMIRYHGTNELRESTRFKTSLELDQKLYYLARLQINNVAKTDGGEYRAVAKNKHGQGTATINLNFEGGDKPKYAVKISFSSPKLRGWRKKKLIN